MNKTTLYLSAETQRRLRDLARRTGPDGEHAERPRPLAIGAGEDSELAARDSEDWLRARWGGA